MSMQRGNARLRQWGAIGLVLAIGLAAGCQKRDSNIGQAAIDADRLVNAEAEPGSWMSHGRTYSEQRFSPLDAISTETIDRLGFAWDYDMGTRRGQEANPIVVDGVMYLPVRGHQILRHAHAALSLLCRRVSKNSWMHSSWALGDSR